MTNFIKKCFGFVVDRGAESAGAHAELNVLNGAYQHQIDIGAFRPLDILRGANAACSPGNELLGGCVNYLVTDGSKRVGAVGVDALFGKSPGVIQGLNGALGLGEVGLGLAAPRLTRGVMPYVEVGLAGYNYLTSSPTKEESRVQESDEPTKTEILPKEGEQTRILEALSCLQELNNDEVAEVQALLKSLTGEQTFQRRCDEAGELVEKIIVDSTVNALSGALGNLTKLFVINKAYDATVAVSGAATRYAFSGLGNTAANYGEKIGRGIAHGFIAAPVAVSKPVRKLSNFGRDVVEKQSKKVLTAGYGYVKGMEKTSKPSAVKTAVKVATLTALGVGAFYVAPGTVAVNTLKALWNKSSDCYSKRGEKTKEQITFDKAVSAMTAVTKEESTGINDAKVTAAFIKLANLSEEEMTALVDISNQIPAEPILAETTVEEICIKDQIQTKAIDFSTFRDFDMTAGLTHDQISEAIKAFESQPMVATCA